MPERAEQATPRKAPSMLVGGGHLAALWALAVVQPLLSLLGSNPDFFVARDNTGGQIVIFALLLTFVPPLAATAVEALLNLIDRTVRWAFHLVLVALLFSLLMIQVLKQIGDGPAVPMIIVAAVTGALLAWGYGYRTFLRSLTDLLIPAPVIILIVFLFFSDASELTTSTPDIEAVQASIKHPAPVVMLVFDEFPVGSLMTPDHQVNARRFPHFAELETGADWYRNTLTDASYTTVAVPSIASGKAADRDTLPTAADHPESVFTLLGGSYRVRASEPITNLCPPDICGSSDEAGTADAVSTLFDDLANVSAHLNLPEAMSPSLPDISQSFRSFGGSPVDSSPRERAREFVKGKFPDGEADIADLLAARRPAAERTFDFAHVEEPHYPWTHYPDGRSYTDDTEDFRAFISPTEWLDDGYVTERARQAHLLEVGFADLLLGRIMDRIKRDGLWEKTMLVVVADHGGAMTKGLHRREARPRTIGQIAMVPFFVKAPGQERGRTINRTTCISEVLPIMAGHLGVKVPWETAPCDREKVSIDNGTGPVVTSPISTVLRQRDTYIATLSDLFGGHTGWPAVFRLGPNQDLIGASTATLDIEPGAVSASATPDLTDAADSDSEPSVSLAPALRQRGILDGVPGNAPLAVSVNGKVAAVGRSYREVDHIRYSILLPPESLRPGRNSIRLFLVAEEAQGTRLTELWSSSGQ